MAQKLYDKASLVMIPSQYKEGRLFNIKPEDQAKSFEFERGSVATRVNSDGYIDYPGVKNTEIIVNGSFTGGSTGWVLTPSWSYDVNRVFFDRDANRIDNLIQVNQSWTLSQGKYYRLSFDIENVDQNDLSNIFIRVLYQGGPVQDIGNNYQRYGDGTHTIIFLANDDQTRIDFYARGNTSNPGGSFYIDNISIKELSIVPRLDHSGTEPSLLLEPQSTNLVTYSEKFNSSSSNYFGPLGASIDSTSELAPDGTNSASTMLSSGQGKLQTVYKSLPANTTYTLSVYVKNVDATSYETRILANGGSGGTNITQVSRINEINTTSWTRVIHTFTTHTTAQDYIMYISNGVSSGQSVQLWGAQLEQGSYATSYIPTSGQTETRSADVCKGGGDASVFNNSEGVLYGEIEKKVVNSGQFELISINNAAANTDANSVTIGWNNGNNFYFRVKSSSGTFTYQTLFANANQFYKVALKYKSGDIAIWIDGVEVQTSTQTFSFATTLDNLSFDYNGNGVLPFYGGLRALHYFPEALTDTELQQLTSNT